MAKVHGVSVLIIATLCGTATCTQAAHVEPNESSTEGGSDSAPQGGGPGAGAGNSREVAGAGDSCESQLILCQAQCVDITNDVLNCGECERACEGSTLCEDSECVPDCGSLSRCDDECVDLAMNVNHCGACDEPCPEPLGEGNVDCHDRACRVVCDDGEPACGDDCCDPPPPNMLVVCDAEQGCGSRCIGATLKCSDQVEVCGTWGFELDGTDGVIVDSVANAWDGSTLQSSKVRAAEGRQSLAVGLDTTKGVVALRVRIPVCVGEGEGFDPSGFLGFYARVALEPAAGYRAYEPYEALWDVKFLNGSNTEAGLSDQLPLATVGWTSIDVKFSNTVYTNPFTEIIVRIDTYLFDWKGTVYLDDIRIQ